MYVHYPMSVTYVWLYMCEYELIFEFIDTRRSPLRKFIFSPSHP